MEHMLRYVTVCTFNTVKTRHVDLRAETQLGFQVHFPGQVKIGGSSGMLFILDQRLHSFCIYGVCILGSEVNFTVAYHYKTNILIFLIYDLQQQRFLIHSYMLMISYIIVSVK
jgi:hypothetical protein